MKSNSNMKSRRLLNAAAWLLKAMESTEGMDSLIPIYFSVPRTDAVPRSPHYTLDELVDAMTILIHMGFVPTRKNTRKLAHPRPASQNSLIQNHQHKVSLPNRTRHLALN